MAQKNFFLQPSVFAPDYASESLKPHSSAAAFSKMIEVVQIEPKWRLRSVGKGEFYGAKLALKPSSSSSSSKSKSELGPDFRQ